MSYKNIMIGLGSVVLCACHGPQETKPHSIDIVTVEGMAPLGPYSTAVKSGGVLYVSGIIAINPETKSFAPANIEAQTKQVFTNLGKVLSVAECGLTDVIKITVYLKNPKDFPAMNTTFATYFPDYKPARTTVPGADWGRDNVLIEIDVIAKLP